MFTQEAVGRRSDGSLFPQTQIDPGSMEGLRTWTHDLGDGRRLEIRTNLAAGRSAEVADSADWNEVRIALLSAGQPLLRPGASAHVTELIYDTLPHELTPSLLSEYPTVHHDLDGQEPQGTRWFIEGVCEKLAWKDESDLYGLSMLLVTAWLEAVELLDLLDVMSARGGDLVGADLRALLLETARLDRDQVLARAKNLGLRLGPSADLSLHQR